VLLQVGHHLFYRDEVRTPQAMSSSTAQEKREVGKANTIRPCAKACRPHPLTSAIREAPCDALSPGGRKVFLAFALLVHKFVLPHSS
jgi:hypothetical protein